MPPAMTHKILAILLSIFGAFAGVALAIVVIAIIKVTPERRIPLSYLDMLIAGACGFFGGRTGWRVSKRLLRRTPPNDPPSDPP